MPSPLFIAVIGENDPPVHLAALAEEVGAEVASAGAVLVCGGMGGAMEAACRGAQRAGGVTIGILPGTQHTDANPYVTYPIPTGLGHARNIMVARSAHALIAIGGKYGTLSEIAFAKIEGKPVIGLDTWELTREGQAEPHIQRAQDAKEAVRLALAGARARQSTVS
ncbi:MAG TPA: TIGR00725 family protein [Candidatus Baltobacteraceae bacterium]|nr:TIGR00725 family protein [Candidatus Baltobacteraceae bacterium]